MGNIFRALRRRKAPSEELDKLVQQISELETQLKQLLDSRSWSLRWILYCALFLTTSSSAYFWLQHPTLKRKFLSISVVLSVGTFTYVALRFVTVTLHDWLIGRKQRRIRFFTERKVAIIEEVKENEKFNVAKDIIEKYGSQSEVREWLGPRASLSQPSKALANGHKKPRMSLEAGTSSTEANGTMKTATTPVPKLYEIQRPSPHSMASSTHRAPIRPFVEESRTPIDRVLDLVMGESINNRYALICANCRSHNGMALREEFETISYYCFRCNFFNPSKAEMSRRNILYASPKMLDFTGNTDESTENEVESERKASTASLNSELSEREEEITPA